MNFELRASELEWPLDRSHGLDLRSSILRFAGAGATAALAVFSAAFRFAAQKAFTRTARCSIERELRCAASVASRRWRLSPRRCKHRPPISEHPTRWTGYASGSAPGSLIAYHGSSVTHSHFCSTTKRPSAPWSHTTMPVPWHSGQSGLALGFSSIAASPIKLCHFSKPIDELDRSASRKGTVSGSQKESVARTKKLAAPLSAPFTRWPGVRLALKFVVDWIEQFPRCKSLVILFLRPVLLEALAQLSVSLLIEFRKGKLDCFAGKKLADCQGLIR